MDFQQTALAICGTAVAYMVTYALYKRYRTTSISDVPGPKNPSWLFGHIWWWQSEEAGVTDKRLLEEFGAVVRWNGGFGEERLWVADPKAIHYVLQGSPHLYEKSSVTRELFTLVADRGIVTVEGDVHKRHRRAMGPAFGLGETKGLYPYFTQCADSLADKWNQAISSNESGRAIIDVNAWFGKAALDAIGTGAFNYDFGAIENTDNSLTKSYTSLGFKAFGTPSKGRLLLIDAFKFVPTSFITWILNKYPFGWMVKLRENRTQVRRVAAQLIEDKRQELKDGTPRRDLLSILVKANSSMRPESRLNDEEIVSQVRTIMLAGHETTAKTLTFALWEFAKNRPVQEKLRAEIMEKLREVRARGDDNFSVDDFDSMPYMLAVGKEILRFYPAVVEILRVAKEDNVLPLSRPVVGLSGKVYKELPVPAGTAMYMFPMGYNFNKDVWGPDACEFRPERWLETNQKPESAIGVYGNLATFSAGTKSCIGWRFAVIEMHTFFVTLLRQFDFSLPANGPKIRAMRSGTLSLVVAGEEDKGPQLPLMVTAIKDDEY